MPARALPEPGAGSITVSLSRDSKGPGRAVSSQPHTCTMHSALAGPSHCASTLFLQGAVNWCQKAFLAPKGDAPHTARDHVSFWAHGSLAVF